MSKTHTNTNSSNIFRDFLRNYDKMENYGLYSVNIDEMQKLKKIQTLKSAKLSKSRQSNIPFHVLLERAKSININKS